MDHLKEQQSIYTHDLTTVEAFQVISYSHVKKQALFFNFKLLLKKNNNVQMQTGFSLMPSAMILYYTDTFLSFVWRLYNPCHFSA